jgi:hypothetical protein
VLGMYRKPVAAVDGPQTSVPTDNPSTLGVCPQRDAMCPNCCHYRHEAT